MAITRTTGATINNATAGTSLAFASTTLTNGQFVVVCVSILVTTVSVSGITDPGGNTYTKQGSINSGTSVRTEIWTAPITAATAARVITVTLSGPSLASAAFEEYAGVSALGNIGTATSGTGVNAEADVATQDGNNWAVCAIAVASLSGDTFTANLGTITRSIIPALTTAATGLIDNSSVGVVSALRNAIEISSSRAWGAIAVELRSGGGSIAFAPPNNAPPITDAGSGANHQIVKPAADQISPPSFFNPVPVAAALKGGTTGVFYSETISAQGGTSPYTFAVTSGSLPTGLGLAGSTGIISGTPSGTGTSSFTITVTDTNGFTGAQGFTIIIASPVLSGGSYTFFS